MKRRLTYTQRRLRREARRGWIMVAIAALTLGGMLYGAYVADTARGISVSASLQGAGL